MASREAHRRSQSHKKHKCVLDRSDAPGCRLRCRGRLQKMCPENATGYWCWILEKIGQLASPLPDRQLLRQGFLAELSQLQSPELSLWTSWGPPSSCGQDAIGLDSGYSAGCEDLNTDTLPELRAPALRLDLISAPNHSNFLPVGNASLSLGLCLILRRWRILPGQFRTAILLLQTANNSIN